MINLTRSIAAGIGVLSLALLAVPAQAQDAGMSPDLAARIADIGRVIDPPKSALLYIPLQEKEPYAGVKVLRDVSYGPDARNLLDVFTPESAGAPRPVLIYVHGGGFVAGTKHAPGSPFYDNIHLWAVRHGMLGVNITYRLAPAASWPSGPQDMGMVVEWVKANIGALGGDPGRIYLMGNSAGATHVTDYLAHVAQQKLKDQRLAGAVLLSGIYDLTSFDAPQQLKAYFGDDVSRFAERSSIHGLLKSTVPLLVSHAEFDPVTFEKQAQHLRDALCQSARGCQTFVVFPKHNHLSQVQSINTADTTLTRHLLKFIQ